MSNTSFAALLRGTDSAGQRTFHFTSDWGQGRAIYGGLIGAALYKTMRGQVPTDRQLRAMTVAFIGPVAPSRQPSRQPCSGRENPSPRSKPG